MARSETPNILKQSSKNPNSKRLQEKDAVWGIYHGVIKYNKDYSRTGKVTVFIAAIAKNSQDPAGYVDAIWSSPFAGSTDPTAVGKDVESPEQTMSSYGFWGVVPDLGNTVLVTFADGNTKTPIVIGCLYPDMYNHMVPGIPGRSTFQAADKKMPAMEKNKRSTDTRHNGVVSPIHHALSEAITKQGLANDGLRGWSTSGARRESPSEVFGILTPGPRDPNNFDNRLGGHQFVMDDNLKSRNIRIRTAKGNQLLLDDTNGLIYMINRDGTAWLELNQAGDVSLYAEGNLNLRAKKDFNIRADYNVNIEAGQDVNIKAAGDNIAGEYTGSVPTGFGITTPGTGGTVNIEGTSDIRQYANQNIYQTAAGGSINLNAAADGNITAGKNITLRANLLMNLYGMMGVTMHSLMNVVIKAGLNIFEKSGLFILMNSGSPPTMPAMPAPTTGPIPTTKIKDAAENPAVYDRTVNDTPVPNDNDVSEQTQAKTQSPLTTSGERTGKVNNIKTIVSEMPTAEPWAGHAVPNPAEDIPENMDADSKLADSQAENSNGVPDENGNNTPADVVNGSTITPGKGYTNDGSTDKNPSTLANAADKAKSASGKVSNAAGAASDAVAQGKAMYGQAAQALSNANPAALKELAKTKALNALTSALPIAIPPVRFPIPQANEKVSWVIGTTKKISEFSARLKQIGITASGLTAELSAAANISELMSLKNNVVNAIASAQSDSEIAASLSKLGVSVINDQGSLILQDALGNKIVDFKGGLGPLSNQLLTAADLNSTSENIKGLISPTTATGQTLLLTDNQMAALTSFANQIGVENFSKSRALERLNAGDLAGVPNAMLDFSNKNGVRQPDMVERRQYEGELFQTPDSFPLPQYRSGKRVSFGRMAQDLKLMRCKCISSNTQQI